jgi:hypothetical protein
MSKKVSKVGDKNSPEKQSFMVGYSAYVVY